MAKRGWSIISLGWSCSHRQARENRFIEAFSSGGKEEIELAAKELLEFEDGVPVPPTTRVAGCKPIAVQRLLTSVICSLGGSKTIGKAPRSAIAYKLLNQLKL